MLYYISILRYYIFSIQALNISTIFLFMIGFSVSPVNEIFPFYSCAYVLHKYGIILKYNFIAKSGLLVSLTSFMKGGDT